MTIPMPEPVAYRSKESPYLFSLRGPGTDGFDGLITTAQAEAYAAARVREALEEAASIAKQKYVRAMADRVPIDEGNEDDRNTEDFNIGQLAQALAYSLIEADIRALIPKQ